MDKKFVNKVLAVTLGIALVAMVFAVFSLIFDAIGTGDLLLLQDDDRVLSRMQWTCAALVCVLIPTLVCFAFTYFCNGKIFNILSAALSLVLAIAAFVFTFVLRRAALIECSIESYAQVTGGFQEFIQIAVCALITCAYFVINTIKCFKKPTDATETAKETAVENVEVKGNEEV